MNFYLKKEEFRKSFFFFFLLVFPPCAILNAQNLNSNVNLIGEQLKLTEIFESIEEQTEFSILYSEAVGEINTRVDLRLMNKELSYVLSEIQDKFPISYKVDNNVISFKITANTGTNNTQQHSSFSVEGKVLDQNGQPLLGANVREKGTSIGSMTDINGNFQINVSGKNAVLEISYLGFSSKEVHVDGRSDLGGLTMIEDSSELNEVVVVGYGKQKKINMTGAVASIDAEDIQEGNFQNTAALMQGRLPGLYVTQNSGAPGAEGVNLQIRGIGTYSGAGANPLVIIDGIAGGDINSIDPATIESISVLKDAASAAIYGARAANGVILISTKEGPKEESFSIDYHFNTGFHTQTQMPDLIWNSVEYMELWNQAIANFGTGGTPYTEEQIDLYRNPEDRNQYPNYNWLEKLFSTVNVNSHTLSLNGRSGQTRYYVQGGYLDQPGTYKGYDMKRTNFQVNLDSRLNKVVEFGTKMGLVVKNRKSPYGDSSGDGVDPILSTLAKRPTYGPVLPDGSGRYTTRAFGNESGNKNSWLVSNEQLYNIKSQDYRLQGYALLKPIDGLEINGTLASAGVFQETEFMFRKTPTFNFINHEPSGNYGNNNFSQTQYKNNLTTVNLYGSYENYLGNHHANILLGSSYEGYWVSSLGGARQGYITSTLTELNAGPEEGQTNSGSSSEWALLSYFGRLNYDYKDKYLVELNARFDGSSRFSRDNRWGFFPSVSAGWNIVKEDGFNINWIQEFKVRGSWGSLGNQDIGFYPYQAMLNLSGSYPFDTTLTPGVRRSALNNSDITWETTTITDFGFDASLFDGKLGIVFDYFNKRTSDILRRADIPLEIGYTAHYINDGVMLNEGVEVLLNTRGHFSKNFTYDFGATFSTYRNELEQYGSVSYGSNTINKEGHPYQSYYLWEVQGLFQSQEEVDLAATQNNNPEPGDLRYIDQNDDGVINSDDKIIMDGSHPDFEYSFNLGLNYKGFALNALFYGVEGRKFYTGQWGYEPFRQGSPPPVKWRDAWTPENQNTEIPRIYPGGTKSYSEPSNFWLEDASYFRLRSLDVSYNFSPDIIGSFGLQGLTLYVSAQNLFTLTKFSGFDPERVGDSVRGGVRYPQNKVISTGVKIKI